MLRHLRDRLALAACVHACILSCRTIPPLTWCVHNATVLGHSAPGVQITLLPSFGTSLSDIKQRIKPGAVVCVWGRSFPLYDEASVVVT